jgi:hypothetical protein
LVEILNQFTEMNIERCLFGLNPSSIVTLNHRILKLDRVLRQSGTGLDSIKMPLIVNLDSVKSSIDDCLDYSSFNSLERLSIDTRGWDQPYTRFYCAKIRQIPSAQMKSITMKVDYLKYNDLINYLLATDFVKVCPTVTFQCDKFILPYRLL